MSAPTPALDAWRARGDWTARDALWVAAAWEVSALELAASGSLHGSRRCLDRAAQVRGQQQLAAYRKAPSAVGWQKARRGAWV